MKRSKRRLPIPQHEFSFAPQAFNLVVQNGTDGDRIARERAEADLARRMSLPAEHAYRGTLPYQLSPEEKEKYWGKVERKNLQVAIHEIQATLRGPVLRGAIISIEK